MNMILLFEDDFTAPATVLLRDRRAAHARGILSATRGDLLRVGLCNGFRGTGSVLRNDDAGLLMEVRLDSPPPPPLPLTLVAALPRPKVLRRLIQLSAGLGIKKIYLIRTWRVDKSYWQTPLLAPGALTRELVLGLEQAGDTMLPEVLLRPRFRPFVEDELPGLARDTRALVAHPAAQAPFPAHLDGPVTLALGPEGGFIPSEILMLERQGFEAAGMGPRILKVEWALPWIAGRYAI